VLVKGAVWSNCGRLVFVRDKVEWNSHVRDTENVVAAVEQDGRPVEPVGEIDVECFDIPSLISLGGGGSVDLLKVDIEGSEAELFSNNVREWLPSIKNIVIELHGPKCEKSFFGALEEYQYERRPFRSVTVCRDLRIKR
jgi:FkbM family methyltransferase